MVGVKLLDYALNKSRVSAAANFLDGERNFNIFYQLVGGASSAEKEAMFLSDASIFAYLKGAKSSRTINRNGTISGTLGRRLTLGRSKDKQHANNGVSSGTTGSNSNSGPSQQNGGSHNHQTPSAAGTEDAIPTQEDIKNFEILKENLKSLGVGRRTQTQLFRVIAAILHLGNILFGIDPNLKSGESTIVRTSESLEIAAGLLNISPSSLTETLLYKSKMVDRELCSIHLTPEGASSQRDLLAQILYSLVFAWLTEHINTRLCKSEEEFDHFIAVVDFPWFRNSFPNSNADFSLFIGNYLQESIIHYTQENHFDDMSMILKSDGVNVEIPPYVDNQWAIDLFRGTPHQKGFFSITETQIDLGGKSARTEEVIVALDNGLKSNAHFIPSSMCSITAVNQSSSPSNLFGIRHHQQEFGVQYDLDAFMEQDIVMSDFVSLFRGSTALYDAEQAKNGDKKEVSFIADLFSARTGVKTLRSGRGAVVAAHKPTGPIRKPSIKRKNKKEASEKEDSPSDSPFSIARTTTDELLGTLKATRTWTVICASTSETPNGKFSYAHIKYQLELHSVTHLIKLRSEQEVDAKNGVNYETFVEKYSDLVSVTGATRGNPGASRAIVKQFVESHFWSPREYLFGNNNIYLSINKWQWIRTAMAHIGTQEQARLGNVQLSGYDSNRTSMRPTSTMLPAGAMYGGIPQRQSQVNLQGYLNDEDQSEIESVYESEYEYKGDDLRQDIELGNIKKTVAVDPKSKREIVDSVTPVTHQRKCWVCCTWTLTWWIPVFSCCGKMKRPDIRMAWREKVALCIIIAFLCLVFLFFVIGLRYVICPEQAVRAQSEIQEMASGQTKPYVSGNGRYYYVDTLIGQHIKDYGPKSGDVPDLQPFTFYAFYGSDVTRLFDKRDRWKTYCPNIQQPNSTTFDYLDSRIGWMNRNDVSPSIAAHHGRGSDGQGLPYQENLNYFVKGKIGWSWATISSLASQSSHYVVIYNNVYYVEPLMQLSNTYISSNVQTMLQVNSGNDISSQWQAATANPSTSQDFQNWFTCLNNVFYIGTVDLRDTIQCRITNWLLVATSVVIVSIIGCKFIAALQFGSRRDPEEGEKFVICMVPCYTESADSLAKTIDSLTTMKYDDKRKLLFIICDGMIIGSGNDRPTPRIVLDILGVDPEEEHEALPFQSLGEGNRQFNMGKVYSGLYEMKGHSVPFVVVVKVGSPSERVKPGNRGKRDSQLLLMRFLNRVHFNAEFSPLELEVYHHMKNIIGVAPSFYEFVLMVDADTEVEPPALNRMISIMVHDVKVMGLCGETRISNEKESWVTMIQVYEYFISHHMAKAFESLFGTVTCLPGCFCLYRIRTPSKNVPLLVSPALLSEYADNSVDTLHKKNLLHLGEDRYLTTLMLKNFPQMRTKFTSEARCFTVVPERWSVLLSQRRRWINSTVHNLFELTMLDQLCGFCCFSMRFIVFIDLFSTFVQPATMLYICYLIYAYAIAQTSSEASFPFISILLIAIIYGFQVFIFLIKREWQHIAWMIIYILALPVFSFWIPMYSFWHFDDFSWGNTRVVIGEGKKTVYVADAEPFDAKSIPLRRWRDYDTTNEEWERGSQVSHSSTYSNNKSGGYNSEGNKRATVVSNAKYPGLGGENRPMSMVSLGRGFEGNNQQRNSTYNMIGGAKPQQQQRVVVESDGMPSDEQLMMEVRSILEHANLMTVTKKQVREALSIKFGVDLKRKKTVINQIIDDVLQKGI